MFYLLRTLSIIIILFLLLSCASTRYTSFYPQARKANLENLEIQHKMYFDTIEQLNVLKFNINDIQKINVTKQGQPYTPGRLTNKIRKSFTILDPTEESIKAESLFIYTRDGFLLNAPRNAIFYGRTVQSTAPFTISLVSDPNTRIMSGKSIQKNFVLDITGDAFLHKSNGKYHTETGFAIYYKNKMVALFNTTNPPTVFFDSTIYNADLRRTIIFTILFLSTYERSTQYPIK